jgi:hypothetical protein
MRLRREFQRMWPKIAKVHAETVLA